MKGTTWSDIHEQSHHKNLLKIKQKQADLAAVKKEADIFEKFTKLSEGIKHGKKSLNTKIIKYNQSGSENLAKRPKVDSIEEKTKIERLRDNPTALKSLFTGGVA